MYGLSLILSSIRTGDIIRQANTGEVTHLRKEARVLKEVCMIGDGGEDV